jgi:undecaprenyl-diphosphatase
VLDSLLAFDAFLLAWVQALPHPQWLNVLMVLVTTAGLRGSVWLALGVLLAVQRRDGRDGLWRLALALAMTGIVVDIIIKPTVARERPAARAAVVEQVFDRPTTFSFPSGHAAEGAAGAFALSRFWPGAALPLWALAAVIAISRVYLGVHYPLDIIAGFAIGLACAVFVTGGMVYRAPGARR